MSREELLARLRAVQGWDEENAHMAADEALLDFIDDDEVREAFEAIRKWYS